MTDFKPPESCEVCGQAVDPGTAVKADLQASDAMCPSAMTFHPECYELASSMWLPEPDDSFCTVDPLFPETQQWTQSKDSAS